MPGRAKALPEGTSGKCSFFVRKSIDSLPTGQVSNQDLFTAYRTYTHTARRGQRCRGPRRSADPSNELWPSEVSDPGISLGGTGRLTCSALWPRTSHVLKHATPASRRSLTKAVKHAMAPPWLNPPTMILFAGIPASISAWIRPSTAATDRRRPCSSSYVESVRLCSCDKSNHAGMLMPVEAR